MIDLKQAQELVKKIALAAGRNLLKKRSSIVITSHHDQRDFSTNLDVETEKFIVSEIQKKYPDHSFQGEEKGRINTKSDYLWIIDPIDGTKYFEKDIPLYSISIALRYKKDHVLGVVYQPYCDYLYYAYKGSGAFCNGKPLKVSHNKKLSDCIVAIDTAELDKLNKKEFDHSIQILNKLFKDTYRVRALGMGSLSMCWLAQGYFDAYVDITGREKYVDIGGGSVVAQEAGAILFDLKGWKISRQTWHYCASVPEIKDAIIKLLK